MLLIQQDGCGMRHITEAYMIHFGVLFDMQNKTVPKRNKYTARPDLTAEQPKKGKTSQ
jgi:hypothetical protein